MLSEGGTPFVFAVYLRQELRMYLLFEGGTPYVFAVYLS